LPRNVAYEVRATECLVVGRYINKPASMHSTIGIPTELIWCAIRDWPPYELNANN
jgi:hypothetical protein